MSKKIEDYMNNDSGAYNWKKHAEFKHLDKRYVIMSEISPTGEQDKPFMLYESYGSIFNERGDLIK